MSYRRATPTGATVCTSNQGGEAAICLILVLFASLLLASFKVLHKVQVAYAQSYNYFLPAQQEQDFTRPNYLKVWGRYYAALPPRLDYGARRHRPAAALCLLKREDGC